jgi:hypothetical protein
MQSHSSRKGWWGHESLLYDREEGEYFNKSVGCEGRTKFARDETGTSR